MFFINSFEISKMAIKRKRKRKAKTSRIERWIGRKLKERYPNLTFQLNPKDIIGSELDIYIPEIQLAIEINGIFHYKPIFGEDKLAYIQNNDSLKVIACANNNIDLCVVDCSQFKTFKNKRLTKSYLSEISRAIDAKIVYQNI